MNDIYKLTIDSNILNKSKNECKHIFKTVMYGIDNNNNKFFLHIINNPSSTINNMKNISNIIILGKFLHKNNHKIHKIIIHGKSYMLTLVITIVKSLLKYHIEEYINYIE
jgi:hypothetical protein